MILQRESLYLIGKMQKSHSFLSSEHFTTGNGELYMENVLSSIAKVIEKEDE